MRNTFLESIAKLDCDPALDQIFSYVNDKMSSGQEAEIDSVLDQINVDQWSEDLLVGFLAATRPGRDLLPARAHLISRVSEKLIPEIGEDETIKLLKVLN